MDDPKSSDDDWDENGKPLLAIGIVLCILSTLIFSFRVHEMRDGFEVIFLASVTLFLLVMGIISLVSAWGYWQYYGHYVNIPDSELLMIRNNIMAGFVVDIRRPSRKILIGYDELWRISERETTMSVNLYFKRNNDKDIEKGKVGMLFMMGPCLERNDLVVKKLKDIISHVPPAAH